MKTGSVDLPLHPGKCPPWLFQRMKPLARELSTIIIENYGTAELLRRLSDPMFFQALGCALAFDWHSSGLTTTTCGAIKEALMGSQQSASSFGSRVSGLELGVVCCGGKGKTSKLAPVEIAKGADSLGLDAARLIKASRLAAKVDNSLVQDGYDLYHHSFLFDEKGNWTVIQQGMNGANKYARRYHWFSGGLVSRVSGLGFSGSGSFGSDDGSDSRVSSFVDSPPHEIVGTKEPEVLNLVSKESADVRKVSLDLVRDNPARMRKYFDGQTTLFDTPSEHVLPMRHNIRGCDLKEKDWKLLQEAYELQPEGYEELVSLKGMGKRKLRALALLAKLAHGSELDWKDPVKYSFSHGGKDGIPYPVDRGCYDHSIGFLKDVINEAKDGEKGRALRRLAGIG